MKKKIFIILFLFIIIQNVAAAMFYNGEEPQCDAVYVVNQETGVPLIEKNIHKKVCPACISKIMVFIIVYENTKNPDEKIHVTNKVLDLINPKSFTCKLKDGDELSISELLHGMLMASLDDAVMVLADYVSGGHVDKFVQMMNDKAVSLGCNDTYFNHPANYCSENHQHSTAADVYKIASYAMNIPDFVKIVNKTTYNVFGDERDPLVTTNHMIDRNRGGKYYYPYARGIKTGFCDEAGRCLVSTATKNGCTYMCVALGGPVKDENGKRIQNNTAMMDSKKIYSWLFENLKLEKICSGDFPLGEVGLEFAWRKDKLLLIPEKDFSSILPKRTNKNEVSVKFDLPKSIKAPVKKGDVIGTAAFFLGNQKLGTVNLISNETARKNIVVVFMKTLKNIVSSPIFIIIFIIFILVVFFYLHAIIDKNKRLKKKNKVKKFPPKKYG